MSPQKAQTAADSSRPNQSKFRKILKIVLIVLICVLGLVAIGNVIYAYDVKKNRVPALLADNEVLSQRIRQGLDTLIIISAVKNFQLLNAGAFPTAADIVAEASAGDSPLLLYSEETIEIRALSDVAADSLDEVGFPGIDSVHIWSGYVCLLNGSETGFFGQTIPNYAYNPDSNSYADAITPGNPQDFAIVAQVSKLQTVSQFEPGNINTVRCYGTGN